MIKEMRNICCCCCSSLSFSFSVESFVLSIRQIKNYSQNCFLSKDDKKQNKCDIQAASEFSFVVTFEMNKSKVLGHYQFEDLQNAT